MIRYYEVVLTLYHFDVVGYEAHIVLDLKTRMAGIFQNQASRT